MSRVKELIKYIKQLNKFCIRFVRRCFNRHIIKKGIITIDTNTFNYFFDEKVQSQLYYDILVYGVACLQKNKNGNIYRVDPDEVFKMTEQKEV